MLVLELGVEGLHLAQPAAHLGAYSRVGDVAQHAAGRPKDANATLKLGQARGVAMLIPARAGIAVAEYAPNLVKKTIVGAGHCEKEQIRLMLRVLLPKADPQTHDAADALAIAVTHAHHRQSALLKLKVAAAR